MRRPADAPAHTTQDAHSTQCGGFARVQQHRYLYTCRAAHSVHQWTVCTCPLVWTAVYGSRWYARAGPWKPAPPRLRHCTVTLVHSTTLIHSTTGTAQIHSAISAQCKQRTVGLLPCMCACVCAPLPSDTREPATRASRRVSTHAHAHAPCPSQLSLSHARARAHTHTNTHKHTPQTHTTHTHTKHTRTRTHARAHTRSTRG